MAASEGLLHKLGTKLRSHISRARGEAGAGEDEPHEPYPVHNPYEGESGSTTTTTAAANNNNSNNNNSKLPAQPTPPLPIPAPPSASSSASSSYSSSAPPAPAAKAAARREEDGDEEEEEFEEIEAPSFFDRLFQELRSQQSQQQPSSSSSSSSQQHATQPPGAEAEEEELNVKVLKENFRRFSRGLKTLSQPFHHVHRIGTWEHPSTTILAALLYFFFVYHGCLLLGLVLCALSFLAYTYVKKMTAPPRARKTKPKDTKQSLPDRFRLLLAITRNVQNKFGSLSDTMEKIINLATWEDPAKTMVAARVLGAVAVVLLLLPFGFVLRVVQVVVGVKIFVVEALYIHLPHLRERYDSIGRFWRSLPTDADLDEEHPQAGPAADVSAKDQERIIAAGAVDGGEKILHVFRALRGAHLGKLFVTTRHVVFLHKDVPTTIGYADISRLEKKKAFLNSGLEITAHGQTEPLALYLGMRDVAYDAIEAQRQLLKKT